MAVCFLAGLGAEEEAGGRDEALGLDAEDGALGLGAEDDALGLDAEDDAFGFVVLLADDFGVGVALVVFASFVVFAFLEADAAAVDEVADFVDLLVRLEVLTLMSTPPALMVRSTVFEEDSSALRLVPFLAAAAAEDDVVLEPEAHALPLPLAAESAFLVSRSSRVHCFLRSASRVLMRAGTVSPPPSTAS